MHTHENAFIRHIGSQQQNVKVTVYCIRRTPHVHSRRFHIKALNVVRNLVVRLIFQFSTRKCPNLAQWPGRMIFFARTAEYWEQRFGNCSRLRGAVAGN